MAYTKKTNTWLPSLQLLESLLPLLIVLTTLVRVDSGQSSSSWSNQQRQTQRLHQKHSPYLRTTRQTSFPIKDLTGFSTIDLRHTSFDTGVDGDPSFRVSVPGLEVPLCFRLHGLPGDVIRLLQDPGSEVIANGRIVSSPNSSRTYLGAVSLRRRRFEVLAKPGFLHVNGFRVPWGNRTHGLLVRGHRVIVSPALVAVTLRRRNLTVAMMRHDRAMTPSDDFRYMGFYVTDSRDLSNRTHGMLGQFIHKQMEVRRLRVRGRKKVGKLRVVSPSHRRHYVVRAILRERRNLATNTSSQCWALRRGGRGVVEGSYHHYVVSNMRNASFLPLA